LSADLPVIQLNAGPKKVGVYKGKRLGSGTDLWKYWDELRQGIISDKEWEEIGVSLSCGAGSCNTMGTASTMNGLLEALGVMPLGLSTMPVDSEERMTRSMEAGQRIVQMVSEDLKPSKIFGPASFRNAAVLLMALGGSTNALLHLTAIAGRLNISLYPEVFNEVGKIIPCITDVQPAGKFLIDEFDEAGGIPVVMKSVSAHLDLNVITYTGERLGILLKNIPVKKTPVIRSIEEPVLPIPTLAILSGNLAPEGAVIKVAAASAELFRHTGTALVFDSYEEMLAGIDDPQLEVTKDSVLILRNVGPKGAPGMPEWGMIPIPKILQMQGIKDMVRISDARMSGTSFGTVILHVSPESVLGSNLALVKTGDRISVDIYSRSLNLLISDEELSARKKEWKAPLVRYTRGYPELYIREVLQANEGCDFYFLKPKNKEDLVFIEPTVGRS
jgi:dihydroxyacid dehydratase/phosphogluconate dehydratase